jgi:hypothetical protein
VNQNILTTDDLREATGYQRAGDIERCLKKNSIHFFHSRAGVWTTVALMNAAGGIVGDQLEENKSIL